MGAIPAEAHDLLLHSWDAQDAYEMGVGAELQFSSQLSLTALNQALSRLVAEEQILTSKLVLGKTPHWETQTAPEETHALVVSDEAEYLSYVSEPMKGELRFRAVLWRREGGDRLSIKVDHCLGDAAAGKELIYRLASLYTAAASGAPLPDRTAVGTRRDVRQVFDALPWPRFIAACWDLYRLCTRWYFMRRTHTLSGTLQCDERLITISRFLTPDTTRQIADYGRKHGATLNDMMLAAFYRALASSSGWNRKSPLAVLITVDLRRWLPSQDDVATVSNLSASEITALNKNLGDTFDDTLAKVIKETKKIKEGRPGLASSLMIVLKRGGNSKERAPLTKLKKWDSLGSPPLLTNTGFFDESRMTFGESPPAMVNFTSSSVRYPGLILTLCSYRGAFWIGTRTNESAVPAITAIVDRLLAEMPVEIVLLESQPLGVIDLARA